jgi:hypothetical protein
MKSPFSFLSPILSACLFALVIGGCASPPPSPPGVIQVWAEPPNVRLLRNGKTLSVLHPKLPNVEAWKLVQNGTAIVIKSRGQRHQPAAIELFDTSTGKLIDGVMTMTYSLAPGHPAWARGLED